MGKKTDQLQAQVDALHDEVRTLNQGLAATLGLQGIENVLQNGLSEIITELQPLQGLVPLSIAESMPLPDAEALADLLAALDQPNWSGVDRLPVQDLTVHFIGSPRPPVLVAVPVAP